MAPRASAKKVKDPNAPKRNLSAYFIWLGENRNRIKESLPKGSTIGDIAKAAGVEWSSLDDKTKWEKLAEKDKARYEKEMTAYKATLSA